MVFNMQSTAFASFILFGCLTTAFGAGLKDYGIQRSAEASQCHKVNDLSGEITNITEAMEEFEQFINRQLHGNQSRDCFGKYDTKDWELDMYGRIDLVNEPKSTISYGVIIYLHFTNRSSTTYFEQWKTNWAVSLCLPDLDRKNAALCFWQFDWKREQLNHPFMHIDSVLNSKHSKHRLGKLRKMINYNKKVTASNVRMTLDGDDEKECKSIEIPDGITENYTQVLDNISHFMNKRMFDSKNTSRVCLLDFDTKFWDATDSVRLDMPYVSALMMSFDRKTGVRGPGMEEHGIMVLCIPFYNFFDPSVPTAVCWHDQDKPKPSIHDLRKLNSKIENNRHVGIEQLTQFKEFKNIFA